MAISQPAKAMSAEEYKVLVERFIERKQTDGWPVIPASNDAIDAMVAASGRDPAEQVGKYQLREHPVTVRDIATQAVLAGCLPEYFPIVIAAAECLFPEAGMSAHSGGWVSWIIVNGPHRRTIGLNCRENVFGPGSRPNATIGRAVRLNFINLAGARTNAWDQATQGSAYRYSLCIGEDEESSPWAPLHTDLGFETGDTVVTGFADSAHPRHLGNRLSKVPEEILLTVADEMATIRHFSGVPASWRAERHDPTAQVVTHDARAGSGALGRKQVVVLAEGHHAPLRAAGWTKRQVQEFLMENARRTAADVRRGFGGEMRPGIPDGELTPPLVSKPEDILVVCSGGPGGHSMVGTVSRFDSRKATIGTVPAAAHSTSSAAPHIRTVYELIDRGETDGLPVIPPTDGAIATLVAAARRSAEEALGVFETTRKEVKVKDLARYAVMAGCEPVYMPALAAAFELMIPTAKHYGGSEGNTPWVVFNGPIRAKLGINSGQNVFGPTIRANASMGRALRLALVNMGLEKERSTLGQAYKYTCALIGENEEDSPWGGYQLDRGFAAEDSTVTVFVAGHPRQTSNHNGATAEAMLSVAADDVNTLSNFDAASPSGPLPVGTFRALFGLGSDARTHLKEQGWTRRQAQEFIASYLARKAGDARRAGLDAGRLRQEQHDDDLLRLVGKPEDIVILATGGGGAHDMACRIFAEPRTVRIEG